MLSELVPDVYSQSVSQSGGGREIKAAAPQTSLRENFREIFVNFSRVFASFDDFFEVFGLAGTCLDLFGCFRMRSDATGCVRMHSDAFGKFWKNRSKN